MIPIKPIQRAVSFWVFTGLLLVKCLPLGLAYLLLSSGS
jgi:hypothetical protein